MREAKSLFVGFIKNRKYLKIIQSGKKAKARLWCRFFRNP